MPATTTPTGAAGSASGGGGTGGQNSGWIISHSAPAMFPKEEQDEKDDLSPEEYQEIENELHGIQVFDFENFETPQTVSQSIQEVEDFILSDNIFENDKRAYLHAKEIIPDIVEKETPIIMFLRCEHYDIRCASKRLCSHWTERVKLFGEEYAYKPMTILPDGAMGSSDEHMIQLGLGYVTRCQDDVYGRPVIFLDRANSTKDHYTYNRNGWLKVMWYLLQTICLEENYQKSGYVVIINLKDYDPHKCGDRIGAKKMFLYVRECWCPRFKGYHATYGSKQTPVKLVEPAIRQMQGRHIRLHLRNHYGYDSSNIDSMYEYGIRPHHILTSISGTFTHDDHLQWIQQRKVYEEEMAAGKEGSNDKVPDGGES